MSADALMLMVVYVIAEAYLLYINYLARCKYKGMFREMTNIWRFLDTKNLAFSMLAGMAYTSAIFFGLIFLNLTVAAGVVLGIVVMNAMADDATVRRAMPCIINKCPHLEARAYCVTCDEPEKYRVSVLRQKIEKRSDKKRNKQ